MANEISGMLINVTFATKSTLQDIRFRDHFHINGKYRGSAHQDCNINYR